jgi:UDP-N-acetylmuramoylalanine--D-glutamate ligase
MKVAILGFGREGESAYKYWKSKGAKITVHDNNVSIELPNDVDSVLGPDAFTGLDGHSYDLLVRSPGLRLDTTGINMPITTITNEFLKVCPAKVIGVTGTKGKGTTSTLIYEILCLAGYKAHLLGNIGSPALDELPNIEKDHVVVYEMSSFQLFDIKKSPHVAVCLMVTEDHLDWHSDLDEYQQSKGNIFRFQKNTDVAVYFKEDEVSMGLAQYSAAETKYCYGQGADVSFDNGLVTAFGQEVVSVDEVALPGPHNLQNVAAAICAVWEFTDDIDLIAQVVKTFRGLPYHIEEVAFKKGVTYYNDSFSTNPTSAIAAIRSFSSPQVLFLGGFDKQADFTQLADEIKKHSIRHIITFGQTGAKIFESLKKAGINQLTNIAGSDFKKIILAGVDKAQKGDIVLFSPACASMDMFSDYKNRGQQFNNIILTLK